MHCDFYFQLTFDERMWACGRAGMGSGGILKSFVIPSTYSGFLFTFVLFLIRLFFFFFFFFVTGRLRSDAVEARLGLGWMGTGYTRSCSPNFLGVERAGGMR